MSKYWSKYYGSNDGYDDGYDDYGYGYGGSKSYTKNVWQPSVWSNYSWNGASVLDDNSNLSIKDPVTYITPTKSDIKAKTHVWVDKSIDTIKELARVCYFYIWNYIFTNCFIFKKNIQTQVNYLKAK